MKNFKLKPTLIVFTTICAAVVLMSWGVVGHERINRAAVMALPKPLQTFFYNHIDFITQESTVPDLRRNVLNDKMEPPRHYFDMENFGDPASFPKTMEEAKAKYDEKFLTKNGILPWHIQELMEKLTKAFKDKRKNEILFIAGDLGHYIADGHMPLHTSDNHDGQNTDQKGIHSLWESRLPELFAKDYKFNVPQGVYLENVEKATWDLINDTHSLVEPLLAIDKKLRTATPQNKIFVTDASGVIVKNKYGGTMYSDEYAKQLHADMDGMVEKQMRKAITVTASFWYTAWVNAGKPDLSNLDTPELTKRNSKLLKKDMKTYLKGDLFGLTSDRE